MGFAARVREQIEIARDSNDKGKLKSLREKFPSHFLKSSATWREAIAPSRSKYEPHGGTQEKARRLRQAVSR